MVERGWMVVVVWALSLGGASLVAQSEASAARGVKFAAPKRLQAHGAFLGRGRLYPSPAVHDVDGDGVPDVVVGDLMGKVTVALGRRTDAGVVLSREKPVNRKDGKPLEFENW